MWRVRVVLQLLTTYFLWLAIIPIEQSLFGYNQSQILTYILGTSIIGSLVIASRSYSIGDDINQGNLSNFLIKPINYFAYWFAKDLGDKAMNLTFSIFELTILFLILKPPIFFQSDPAMLALALAASAVAIIMYFFFNLLLGLVGFWSAETWGPRFLFIIVLGFASGGLFPLDILPSSVFTIAQFLPFTYLMYFPLKIYLGQLAIANIYFGLTIALIWTFILFTAVLIIWNRGLKIYTAQGR